MLVPSQLKYLTKSNCQSFLTINYKPVTNTEFELKTKLLRGNIPYGFVVGESRYHVQLVVKAMHFNL